MGVTMNRSETMAAAVAGLAAAVALVACEPKRAAEPPAPAAPGSAQPAAPRISDFSQPMTARGNEPFWALSIVGATLTLTRPDHADLVAQAPGAAIRPGQATWIAKAADGQTLKVNLYVSPCSDGMSDLSYPMNAEVELASETLRGCAAKTAELPKPAG